jgi:hypothetical protein
MDPKVSGMILRKGVHTNELHPPLEGTIRRSKGGKLHKAIIRHNM